MNAKKCVECICIEILTAICKWIWPFWNSGYLDLGKNHCKSQLWIVDTSVYLTALGWGFGTWPVASLVICILYLGQCIWYSVQCIWSVRWCIWDLGIWFWLGHTRLMPRGISGPVCPACSQPTPLEILPDNGSQLQLQPTPNSGSQLQLTSGNLSSSRTPSSGQLTSGPHPPSGQHLAAQS